VEAAAAGAVRVRAKMAAAIELAALAGRAEVDAALDVAAAAGRFPRRCALTPRHHTCRTLAVIGPSGTGKTHLVPARRRCGGAGLEQALGALALAYPDRLAGYLA